MSSYQKVIIVGNLGQDPNTIQFDGGGQVSNVSVATTEKWKNKEGEKQESTEWFRCVLRNKLSELAEKYLSKGDKVLFEGKMKTRKYQNQEGQDVYLTEMIVVSMQFLSTKGANQGAQQQTGQSNASQPSAETYQDTGNNDDLPF